MSNTFRFRGFWDLLPRLTRVRLPPPQLCAVFRTISAITPLRFPNSVVRKYVVSTRTLFWNSAPQFDSLYLRLQFRQATLSLVTSLAGYSPSCTARYKYCELGKVLKRYYYYYYYCDDDLTYFCSIKKHRSCAHYYVIGLSVILRTHIKP